MPKSSKSNAEFGTIGEEHELINGCRYWGARVEDPKHTTRVQGVFRPKLVIKVEDVLRRKGIRIASGKSAHIRLCWVEERRGRKPKPYIMIFSSDVGFQKAATRVIEKNFPNYRVSSARSEPPSLEPVSYASNPRLPHGVTVEQYDGVFFSGPVRRFGLPIHVRLITSTGQIIERSATANLLIVDNEVFYQTVAHVFMGLLHPEQASNSTRVGSQYSTPQDRKYLGFREACSLDQDWALVRIDDPAVLAEVFTIREERISPQAVATPSSASSDKIHVVMIGLGGRELFGRLFKQPTYTILPNGSTFQVTYKVILEGPGRVEPSDSGAMVVDARTHMLYGYVNMACRESKMVYVLAAQNFDSGMHEELGHIPQLFAMEAYEDEEDDAESEESGEEDDPYYRAESFAGLPSQEAFVSPRAQQRHDMPHFEYSAAGYGDRAAYKYPSWSVNYGEY